MGWYDWFARFYDDSVARYYVEHRRLAAQALALGAGGRVLDVPCGTGQSFAPILACVGETGALVGVDQSPGMLRQARARVEREQWRNVRLVECAAGDLSPDELAGAAPFDGLHIFLGMSVFDDMERVFSTLWTALSPGARCVIVDVHAQRLGLQGRMVNLIANADIRRRFWEPLERVCVDFERRDLPYDDKHGGQIMLATGVKPEH